MDSSTRTEKNPKRREKAQNQRALAYVNVLPMKKKTGSVRGIRFPPAAQQAYRIVQPFRRARASRMYTRERCPWHLVHDNDAPLFDISKCIRCGTGLDTVFRASGACLQACTSTEDAYAVRHRTMYHKREQMTAHKSDASNRNTYASQRHALLPRSRQGGNWLSKVPL